MKKYSILVVLLVFTLVSCVNKKTPLAKAEWLLGTWEQEYNFEEKSNKIWEKINDNEFVGKSYFIKGTDTIIWENMSLLQKQDSLFYIATIKEQNNNLPICFSLISISKNEMIFEYPKHDYLTKILCRKMGKDSLVVEMFGSHEGKPYIIINQMRKIE